MAQLMMKNQERYVPMRKSTSGCNVDEFVLQEPIFFDGDALTEERARNAQWMFKDGDSAIDRLEGLDPVHTDWHAKVKLYEVGAHQLFSSYSDFFIHRIDTVRFEISTLRYFRPYLWSNY